MPQLDTLRFHTKAIYTGTTGVVDFQNHTIKGVSCITGDSEAEGHSLYVDSTTLTQLHALSKELGKVPVTLNHDGGIEDVNGYLHNFRIDDNKLRADWVLLETHKETPTMLERAEKQPGTFGLSYSFKGDPKGVTVGDRQCARAEAVMSCDCVKRPAANRGGLFSAKDQPDSADLMRQIIELAKANSVDTQTFSDRSKSTNKNLIKFNMADPTLQDILSAVQGLTSRLEAAEQANQQIVDHINAQAQQGEPQGDQDMFDQLSQLNAMTDEQLAEHGFTRAEVDAAVGEYNASIGGEQGEGDEGGEQGNQHAEGAQGGQQMAGAAAGGAEGSAAAFSALQRELIQLKARINRKEAQEIALAEKAESEAVNQKIELLAKQRDDLVKFSEKLVAHNEALQLHVRTGTRPAPAGVNNTRLFSANADGGNHPFIQKLIELKAKDPKMTDGQAIKLANKEDNGALHQDWLRSQAEESRTIRA